MSTQAQADLYACYERIFGSLSIDDSSALSIALPNLRAVYGPVHIVYSSDAESEQVRAVSLPQLHTIVGALALDYPGADGAFYGAQIAFGLEALVNMWGDITVTVDNSGANLSGLRALERLFGDLTVSVTSGDVAGGTFLDALHTVTGDVTFIEGHNTFGLLRALQRIGGSLHIDGLMLVLGLSGDDNFGVLERVGKDVVLRNVQLSVAPMLVPLFHSLSFVGRKLDLENVSFIGGSDFGLNLGAAQELRVGSLRVVATELDTLEGNALRVVPWGTISIRDNPDLCQAEAEGFIDDQRAQGFFGLALASDNGAAAMCP